MAQQRRELAYAQQAAFDTFGKAVFAEGALSAKTKQIIAVAVAHVTQCPYLHQGTHEGGDHRGFQSGRHAALGLGDQGRLIIRSANN